MRRAWFRHKSIGFGVTPMTWEGWLCVLGLLLVVVPTMVLLGDPSPAKPDSFAGLVRLRAELGLGDVRLPFVARYALVVAELGLFWLFARTRTAPDRHS